LPRPGVRLVVFDLDGTLVDSLRDLADSANVLLGQLGGDPLPDAAVGRMVGDGAAMLVQRVLSAGGVSQPADALERFLAIYDGRLLRCSRPYPGIEPLLERLEGRARLAVLTNKPLGATRRILEGLNLARHFPPDHIIGGDGPFPRKPDPAGLRHLAKMADADMEKVLLVGDSVIDARTAHAAGARLCMARYGFGFTGFPPGELGPSDAAIDSPFDLDFIL